jgi:mitochondrial Rho GTPase 1
LDKNFCEAYTPTTRQYGGVNSVETGGAEKYLVMQEFGPNVDAEVLQNRKRMESCDVICLVYDSADVNSFAYVASLLVCSS